MSILLPVTTLPALTYVILNFSGFETYAELQSGSDKELVVNERTSLKLLARATKDAQPQDVPETPPHSRGMLSYVADAV